MTRLRILMVSHVPLVRELGGGRVQLEVGEALTELGHTVERFDSFGAFGEEKQRRLHRLTPMRFATRARSHVQRNVDRWDVIDAQHGDLPYPKQALGFRGLMVSRSVGLYAFYREYTEFEWSQWPELLPGTRLGQAVHRWNYRRSFEAGERSMRLCDLAIVPNEDERTFVGSQLGLGDRCVALPFGLTDRRVEAFASTAIPLDDRLRANRVAFVGSWTLRKGSADWPEIVRRVRERVPAARFVFLGTGVPPARVLPTFSPRDRDFIEVVPEFDDALLPSLLADATVGAFPSYAEGFGFGVLEQLAAGLPTVVYDVPGPRDLVRGLDYEALVPAGDTEGFAEAITALLSLERETYSELAGACRSRGESFRWREIAQRTAAAYALGLTRIL